ncbi:hypothetical protein EpCFBP13511_24465 [Erwinia persicina]|uniref:Uncharacterized protein n=1 Tax=Erwinia persicina TaxID=55211 RepID=A0A4V5U783_9GAMM|nr:hypothetical protein EpCFBP13511_24465 [Erwinia persicina]
MAVFLFLERNHHNALLKKFIQTYEALARPKTISSHRRWLFCLNDDLATYTTHTAQPSCAKLQHQSLRDEKDCFRNSDLNRPGFPGECFVWELRLP